MKKWQTRVRRKRRVERSAPVDPVDQLLPIRQSLTEQAQSLTEAATKMKSHYDEWLARRKVRLTKRFEYIRRVVLAYNKGAIDSKRFYKFVQKNMSNMDNLWVAGLMSEVRVVSAQDINKVFDTKKEDWINGERDDSATYY